MQRIIEQLNTRDTLSIDTPEHSIYAVYLNGVELMHVRYADASLGIVVCIKTYIDLQDPNKPARYLVDEKGRLCHEVFYGDVEIRSCE